MPDIFEPIELLAETGADTGIVDITMPLGGDRENAPHTDQPVDDVSAFSFLTKTPYARVPSPFEEPIKESGPEARIAELEAKNARLEAENQELRAELQGIQAEQNTHVRQVMQSRAEQVPKKKECPQGVVNKRHIYLTK